MTDPLADERAKSAAAAVRFLLIKAAVFIGIPAVAAAVAVAAYL